MDALIVGIVMFGIVLWYSFMFGLYSKFIEWLFGLIKRIISKWTK